MQSNDPDVIVSSDAGRESDFDATIKSDDRNASGTGYAEIVTDRINGIEVESGPDTERIGGQDGNTSGGEPRRTKSGKIDGRTTRGKRGPKTASEESIRLSVSLEKLLYSIHLMGAEFLKTPELELEKDEAKKLSDAIEEVGKHYKVAFDPKKVAIAELAVVGVSIYGPMLVQVRRRWKTERMRQPLPATPINTPRPQQTQSAPPPAQSRAVSEMSPSDLFGNESAVI
jgi:hypothetical protein